MRPFGLEEIEKAGRRLKSEVANYCLDEGVFSEEWKEARLELLETPKKNAADNPTYRSICLLNAIGKFLKILTEERINEHLRAEGDLSERQYGFRLIRSEVDRSNICGHIMRLVDEYLSGRYLWVGRKKMQVTRHLECTGGSRNAGVCRRPGCCSDW
jgi:hypothetical protein